MADTGQIRAGVVRSVISFADKATQTSVGSLLAHYDVHMADAGDGDELVLYTLDAKRVVDMLEDAGADEETVDRVVLGLEAAALDSEANDEDDLEPGFWYDADARAALLAVLVCHRQLPSGACACGLDVRPHEVHVADVFEEAMLT